MLEKEIHPVKIHVKAETKEEIWALRVSLIYGIDVARTAADHVHPADPRYAGLSGITYGRRYLSRDACNGVRPRLLPGLLSSPLLIDRLAHAAGSSRVSL